ncbi:hypothetical protein PG984_010715 [Apiospora sp. TS-2023a]
MSSLDPDFVMSYENSSSNGFEIVHDEQDDELFRNASYKVPLITIAPGEREQDWACPPELAHGVQIEHLLRCVSVMRVGNNSGAWWGRYLSPPLRSDAGDYLAFMFVLGREGERKRKYVFPPLKVLDRYTTFTGEHSWVGLDVPQHRDFKTLRAEMAKYEKQYNDPNGEPIKSVAEQAYEAVEKAHNEDLIFRVEAWLETLSIEDSQEVGRRRGRRGGRGRGRGGRDRNLYDPEEKPQTQERKGTQRDKPATTGMRLRQTAGRQILKKSPEKPVVRQILKRQVDP